MYFIFSIATIIIYFRVIVHGRKDLDFIHEGFLLIHMQKLWPHSYLDKASDRSWWTLQLQHEIDYDICLLSFLVDNLPCPAKVLGLLPKNEIYFDWDDDIPPRYVIKYFEFWAI